MLNYFKVKSIRTNAERFNYLRNVKDLLKITFVLMFSNITLLNSFKSSLWSLLKVLGGRSCRCGLSTAHVSLF